MVARLVEIHKNGDDPVQLEAAGAEMARDLFDSETRLGSSRSHVQTGDTAVQVAKPLPLLSTLGLAPDVSVEDLPRDSLTQVKEILDLLAELRKITDQLRNHKDQIDPIIARLPELVARIDAKLTQLQEQVGHLYEEVERIHADVAKLGPQLPARIMQVAVISTLLLLWGSLAQLCLLLAGKALLQSPTKNS
jgi:hypothetical protein